MSKYIDIIRMVDGYRPNALDEQLKLWWLVNLDGQLAVELMQLDPVAAQNALDCEYPDGLNHEPLIGYPYEELYLHYLEAKISYTENELDAYQNAMEAYNAAYRNYAVWFLNHYDPVQGRLPGRFANVRK